VAVLDKNVSLGSRGAAALEVRDALYGSGVSVQGYIIGLEAVMSGKRDIASVGGQGRSGEGDIYYGLRQEVLR